MRELVASYTRKDFRMDVFCTGGPGGQNQNKKMNGVRFTHLPTGLSAESREHKSREQNRKAAFRKLALQIQRWHERQLKVEHIRSEELVRTYHEPDNRVKDHATGLMSSYHEVLRGKAVDPMVQGRRRADVELGG